MKLFVLLLCSLFSTTEAFIAAPRQKEPFSCLRVDASSPDEPIPAWLFKKREENYSKIMEEMEENYSKMEEMNSKIMDKMEENYSKIEEKNLKIIALLEEQVLSAQENEARTRAEFRAEINIRPIIEKNLVDWCKANGVSPNGGQNNIDAFFKASGSIENHLEEAKKDVGTTSSLTVLKKTMTTLFDALSKPHHNVNSNLLRKHIGFVISIGSNVTGKFSYL